MAKSSGFLPNVGLFVMKFILSDSLESVSLLVYSGGITQGENFILKRTLLKKKNSGVQFCTVTRTADCVPYIGVILGSATSWPAWREGMITATNNFFNLCSGNVSVGRLLQILNTSFYEWFDS